MQAAFTVYYMAANSRSLLFSAIPLDDESLIGYLLRLTERNHYETLSWMLQLAELKDYAHSKFSLTSFISPDLSPLEKLTGVEETKLRVLLYHPVDVGGKLFDYSIFGSPVPPYIIRLRYPKVCPPCLRESSYLRKVWELAPVTVCPRHRILLLDECPNCKKRITWGRATVSKCKCNFDWREHESPLVEDGELIVTTQVYRRCNLVTDGGTTSVEAKTTCPLYALKLDQYLSALFFIAGQFNGIMDTRGKRLAVSLRNSEVHGLLRKANRVFENWPNNFFSFLDWKREHNPDVRHSRGLRRDFGQYKSALYVQLSPDCYSFLRKAFEEYIAVHWDGGYTTALSRLNEDARLNKKFFTRVEVMHLLNITPKSVDGLIAAGRLSAAKQSRSAPALGLIEAESARQLQAKLNDALTFRQAGEKLGLHPQRMFELITSNVLNPLRGPIVDGCHWWKFAKEEINNLIERLRSKVSRGKSVGKSSTLDLEYTLRKMRQVGGDCGTLVRTILQGEITPCGKTAEPGLSGLLFPAEQVNNYVFNRLRQEIGQVHTIKSVAGILGVTETEVYSLVNKGILKAKKYPKFYAFGQVVTEEELDNFVSNYYVLTRNEALKLRTQTNYIAKLLANKGISPISARDLDGGTLSVYRKSDVAHINLSDLVSESRPKNFNKRMTLRTFDLTEISNLLGVNIEIVQRLVENGFIKPFKRSSSKTAGEGKFYFPYKLAQVCNRRGIEYTSLFSTQVAAETMGVTINALRHHVKVGRLSPFCSKEDSHNFYFLKADVEAFCR